MKVHGKLGNGFQEVIYQRALKVEMEVENISFERVMEMMIVPDGLGELVNMMGIHCQE